MATLLRSLSWGKEHDSEPEQEAPSCTARPLEPELQGAGSAEPASAGQQDPVVEEDDGGAYVPDVCVKLIQTHLIAGEQPGVALLHLLSMAAVCKQWRGLASELAPSTCLAFDCMDNAFSTVPSVQKFRKLTSTQKEAVFASAARRMTGYGDVVLCGDGVSDRVLQEVAAANGPTLTKCKVHTSSNVTDVGLSAMVSRAKALTALEVGALSKPCTGKFLPLVLETCPHLTTLHLTNIPTLSWAPCKAAAAHWAKKGLTKLTVRGVNLDTEFGVILSKLPDLQELELDGHARSIADAAKSCPNLVRVSYTVSSRTSLDDALAALMLLPKLRQLELIVKNFTLCADQLRIIGMLPLVELRLDSFIHKQQPTLSRSNYSHVDNEGVKALVDSICNRWCTMGPGEMKPLKLSLCGASTLTHDAVSALLRLPILTELDIGGCARIIAMDKMRLVAKVRAGRELLDSGRRPATRTSRFPGLLL